ncbi:MAG: TIGR02186 family protein [Rubrimonas sp.]|uniref:TIGR02186 family protein n=1 Tax=Rubrimonas sp. TaxID=2036015 RepID=UPI002FDEBBCC
MRRVLLLLALLLGASAQAQAPQVSVEPPERVVAALSQNRISITADFDGSEIFVYGAIARTAPALAEPPGVVVRVIGPAEPVTVRRKGRVAGIWANVEQARLESAPSYFAVASTGPFHQTISHTADLRHGVSLEHALRFVGAASSAEARESFLAAVVRLRRESGLYAQQPGGVDLVEGTLFRASFVLPANIVEGGYRASVFLTRDREVIDMFETQIDVRKAGIERAIFDLAQNSPAVYALVSIAVAVLAGLAASEAFRYLAR